MQLKKEEKMNLSAKLNNGCFRKIKAKVKYEKSFAKDLKNIREKPY